MYCWMILADTSPAVPTKYEGFHRCPAQSLFLISGCRVKMVLAEPPFKDFATSSPH